MSKKVTLIINPVIKNSVNLLQKTYSGKQDPTLLKKYMKVMSKQFAQSAIKLKALEKNASPVTLDKSKKEVKDYLNKTTNFIKRIISASSKKVTGPIKLTESVFLESKKGLDPDLYAKIKVLKNLLLSKFNIKLSKTLEKKIEKAFKEHGSLSFFNVAEMVGIKLPRTVEGLKRLAKKKGLPEAVAAAYDPKLGKKLRKEYKPNLVSSAEIKKLSEKEKKKENKEKYKNKNKGENKNKTTNTNEKIKQKNFNPKPTATSSQTITSGVNPVGAARLKEKETNSKKKETVEKTKYINTLKRFLIKNITSSNTSSEKRNRDALKNFEDFLKTNPSKEEIKEEFRKTIHNIQENNKAGEAEKEVQAKTEEKIEKITAKVEELGGDVKSVKNTISVLAKSNVSSEVVVDKVMSILKQNQPIDPPNTFLPFIVNTGVKSNLGGGSSGQISSKGIEFTNYLQKMIYYFLQSYREVIKSKTSKLEGLVIDMQKSLKKKNENPSKKVKITLEKLESLRKEMTSESVTDKNLKKFELQYAKYYDYLKKNSSGNLEDYGDLEKEKKNSIFMAKMSSLFGKILGYISYAIKYAILYIKRLFVLFKTHILVGLSVVAVLAIAIYVSIVVGRKQEKEIVQEEESDVRTLDAAAKVFKVSSIVLSLFSKKV